MLLLLAACGTERTVGAPTGTDADVVPTTSGPPPTTSSSSSIVPAPPTSGVVDQIPIATCTDPPSPPRPGPDPQPGVAEAANRTADAHPDVFAGAWWDGTAGQFVFSTVDAEAAGSIIDGELPPEMTYRLETVPRAAADLEQLQARVVELQALGVPVAGSSRRIRDALVEVNLSILDRASVDAVRQVFGDDLDAICVTGADPATVPPDGPQPTSGEGWVLLADQTMRGEPYSVHVAVDEAEYDALWAALSLDGEQPEVEFGEQIVVHFGAVYSGTCPEIRLDAVLIDDDTRTVSADVVVLGGDRACTDDANPRAYVVAIDRDQLPAPPFGVALSADCPYCERVEVVDLTGSVSPAPPLGDGERTLLLAAAARHRVLEDNSFGGGAVFDTADVVDALGTVGSNGFIGFDQSVLLGEGDRTAIIGALAPAVIRFVAPDAPDMAAERPGYALLSLAQPAVDGARVTIATNLWCGGTCGIGGANVVRRLDDGTWSVGETVGPQWIS